MTAVSLIVQPAEAHLVTDGAFYQEDGTLLSIASKVLPLPSLRMAIAVSGSVLPERVAEALGRPTTQEGAIEALPAIVQKLRQENESAQPLWTGKPDDLNGLQVAVAAWSSRHGRAIGYIVASNGLWAGPSYRPFTLAPVDHFVAPPVDDLPYDPRRPEAFRPRRHGRSILAAQRMYAEPSTGAHFVGGFGELTTVDRNGVRQERLVTWPDRVGERIAA